MMRISSGFLALLVLFQSSFWNLDDVSRMDALIEHAKFHAEAYGDNFVVFLSKHYGELQQEHDKQHQEEQSEHENLPFQTYSSVLVVADLCRLANIFALTNAVVNKNGPQHFYYQENYASLADFEIFQPPRLT